MAAAAAAAAIVVSEEDIALIASQEKDEDKKVAKARANVGEALEAFLNGRPLELGLLKVFVREQMKVYAPSTMWTRFSHMKRYILDKYHVIFSKEQLQTITDYLSKKQKHWEPKQASVFRHEDVKAVVASVSPESDKIEVRDVLIFLVGIFMLGRVSEVAALTMANIKLDRDGYIITPTRKKSEAKYRSDTSYLVPFIVEGIDTRSLWNAYLALIPADGWLWRRLTDKNLLQLKIASISEVTVAFAKKLNLPDAEHYTFSRLAGYRCYVHG